jgi:hypothetical protein
MNEKTYEEQVRDLAKSEWCTVDGIDIDDDAEIADGDCNGAWVASYVWVSFAGTSLDKED